MLLSTSLLKYDLFVFFLQFKYSLKNISYSIVGSTRRDAFYYWSKFSQRKFRTFNTSRTFFNGFKFTKFYFSPSFGLQTLRSYKLNIINFRKKISFLKKKDNFKRYVLFRVGSHSWKRFIFKRSLFAKTLDKRPIFKTQSSTFKKFQFNYFSKNKVYEYSPATDTKSTVKFKKQLNLKYKISKVFNENRRLFLHFYPLKQPKVKKFNNAYASFLRINTFSLFKHFEFTVSNILLRSRLSLNTSFSNTLCAKNFIYCNGILVESLLQHLAVGDRLQLIISKSFFFIYKRMLSQVYLTKKFTGTRIWKLTRFAFNFYKQSPYGVPKWISLLMYYKLDVPKFIEVDYLVLTAIIIFPPFYSFDYSGYTTKYINFALMRLYVWKYLT